MKALSARQLGQVMNARVSGDATEGSRSAAFANAATSFTAVFTDSRKVVRGGLFVALEGEHFDGNDFVADVMAAGAAGAVVARGRAVPGVMLEVDDTQRALEQLGSALRNLHPGRFVAITGSVGKTTAKDMLAAALSPFGKVGKTPGNLNNHIGVPLTLAGLDGDEAFVVAELGMSAPGEIARLAHIVRADVALVTRAEAAHLEFFADVDGIADAKAELYEHLAPAGIAVVNLDDARMTARAHAMVADRTVTYGRVAHTGDRHVRIVASEHQASGLVVTLEVGMGEGHEVAARESYEVKLSALGLHNAENVAAAIACCVALGLDLRAATSALSAGFKTAKHRMELAKVGGLTLLDDCYNANPVSTRAALDAFADLTRTLPVADRLAVIGSMRELGPTADALHAAIGAAASSIAGTIVATGPHAAALANAARDAGANVFMHDDVEALLPSIGDWARAHPTGAVLIKGSRGERLERVADHLVTQRLTAAGGR